MGDIERRTICLAPNDMADILESHSFAADVEDDSVNSVLPPVRRVAAHPAAASRRRDTFEEFVERAERLIERRAYAEATATLNTERLHGIPPELVARALFAESWAYMHLDELDQAIVALERALDLVERASLGDLYRAEALYRLGCCRLNRAEVAKAVSLFTLALGLCQRSGARCEKLRAQILERRSGCYRRQREWDAARADVEAALEFAEIVGDPRVLARVHVQAALVAEREGQLLLARFYADEAKAHFERCDDRRSFARLLIDLGELAFRLGRLREAAKYLDEGRETARAAGAHNETQMATSLLAKVYLSCRELELAEREARDGLRAERAETVGCLRLVLGRSLLEQERHEEADEVLRAAQAAVDAYGSARACSGRCRAV